MEPSYAGDGGAATGARLDQPEGVLSDQAGNIFIADSYRVREVTARGKIFTVAGVGTHGFAGDGGPATKATLDADGLALDPTGGIFVSDTWLCAVRKIQPDGTISTVAGTGTWDASTGFCGSSGDGGPATSAQITPYSIAADLAGNLYIAGAGRIRRVTRDGRIDTIAGTGTRGYSGDGGPAVSAQLSYTPGIAVDSSGNLYVADINNSRVRKITLEGIISTVAGNGGFGFDGDGGPATVATLDSPQGVAVDPSGNIYIDDIGNSRIRMVAPNGKITTVAGSGDSMLDGGYSGDGGLALSASLRKPTGVALDSSGSLYVADSGNNRIRKVATDGTISTFAGTGTQAYSGDGGPASSAQFYDPEGIGFNAAGELFIADAGNNCVRKIARDGTVTTIAGTGVPGYSGDGGPATHAQLDYPIAVAFDPTGNLLIADQDNSVIRRVSLDGVVTTAAGNGTPGHSGDGGAATRAQLNSPSAVVIDAGGNLYISDTSNHVIRKVAPDGIISTYAGNYIQASTGDNGPATAASLTWPKGIAMDPGGNLLIATENLIRMVSPDGIIRALAGTGSSEYAGDGGPAGASSLDNPVALAARPDGTVYVADTLNHAIRMVVRYAASPLLSVRKSHDSDFAPSQSGAGYSLVVSNASNAGWASGNLTTTDLLPAALGLQSMAGSGWSCLANRCSRSDALAPGSSYPPISVSVNVASAAPSQLENQVVLSGGGGVTTSAADLTNIHQAAPSIAPGGIVSVGSSATTIQPGEWVSIYGTNLASGTVTWNGDFLTSLGGTSVTINGKKAYLWYVSPGQINLQSPDDATRGSVPVVVTTANGSSTSTATLGDFGPSFLLLDAKHVTGIIYRGDGSGAYGGGGYDIIGPTGSSLGYSTIAAKAGDIVELFGVGFGPTSPAVAAGQAFSGAAPTNYPVTVLINSRSVTPSFAGLSGAGLYQFNLTVPSGLGTGDVSLQASVGGVQTPPGVVITLQ
jgi:uncharacterized protein (TIGR03437 family)